MVEGGDVGRTSAVVEGGVVVEEVEGEVGDLQQQNLIGSPPESRR